MERCPIRRSTARRRRSAIDGGDERTADRQPDARALAGVAAADDLIEQSVGEVGARADLEREGGVHRMRVGRDHPPVDDVRAVRQARQIDLDDLAVAIRVSARR